jgi:hypothetical protein
METFSHNEAEAELASKGRLDEIKRMPRIWSAQLGQANYDDRTQALADLGGWETEKQIEIGPDDRPHNERLTPFFDCYHEDARIAVEHERKEQMRARWHLMKMEVGYRNPRTPPVDVGAPRRCRCLDCADRPRPLASPHTTRGDRATLFSILPAWPAAIRDRV